MNDEIIIRGAKEHNLKNVSLSLPKNKLIVFTGVSGSGKSSLAFDTIFAEGQRRYVESLSSYARQFLGQMDKPDVESIEGLSPAIAIDQKSTSNNPRSTVGTVTEIYDHLRLLYARIGTAHCPSCGDVIEPQSLDEIVDGIMAIGKGSKIQLIAPLIKGKKGEHSGIFKELKQEGFIRVRVDGEIYNLDEETVTLAKTKAHTIDVIVDRIIVKDEAKSRIADSVQIALKKSNGFVGVNINNDKEIIFSEKFTCHRCSLSFEELTPRMFSFNSPFGACEACSGLGADFEIAPELIIPDKNKSINQGAVYVWAKTGNSYYSDLLKSVCDAYNIDMDLPFKKLEKKYQDIILYGTKGEKIKLSHADYMGGGNAWKTYYSIFHGVIPYLKKRYEETSSDYIRDELKKYMTEIPCTVCNGARLKPFPLAVTINEISINELCEMSIEKSYDFINSLFLTLSDYQMKIAKRLLMEIRDRMRFLIDVGLKYLTLSRTAGTLSGGEAQRIRLATQIGSGLTGVLYVLDEPSIGLHQLNNEQLINTLIRLRNLGNTLVVVEHDEETILNADYIVDIGPNAGIHGGEIVALGDIEDIKKEPKSLTGQYLSGKKSIAIPKSRREGNGNSIKIVNATKNNLKNVDVEIPLGKFVTVTGVSGSGKSSLIFDILHKFALHKLNGNTPMPQGVD
jgi:excinuclease ABC subunit A